MSILDKINEETRVLFNNFFDKEPLNYLEAATLYGVVAQGRYNVALLEVLYNHAQDEDLKVLIKEALSTHTRVVIDQSEEILQENGNQIPNLTFSHRTLHKKSLSIDPDAHLTDGEIAIAVGTMAKASQMAMLTALHQSYQVDVAMMYKDLLNRGLDWDYKLLQLMLKRGWLPRLHKMTH
ncbi:DUF3231 family protein [Anaerosinus massiliensis]|uniref:DUF3231 family protein n=1 Tax=Massilibacillus massiliensis TaxID=1806837 RepID=UPI000DA5F93D|nr:DUF3231 family protein [Massilibacillus massiliensis]